MSEAGGSGPGPRRGGRPPSGRDPRQARPPSSRPAPGGDGADDEHQSALGAVLVGIAVVIGIVLLVRGFTDEGGLVAGEVATTTTTLVADEVDRNAPPTIDPGTDTTVAPAPDPAEISVVAANGAGITGLAGQTADVLSAAGFVVVDTSNATSVEASVVYVTAGAEASGAVVASALGLAPEAVQPMPDPPPVPDLAGATVVVVAGPDLADGAVTTTTAATG